MKSIKFFSLYNLVLISIVTLPFDQLFTSAFPNFPISPFRILILGIAVFFLKYNLNNLGNLKYIIVLFYVYVFFSLISVFWSEDMVKSILYTVQLFLLLAFLIVSVNELMKSKESLIIVSFYSTIVGGVIAQLSLFGFFSERELNLDQRISFVGIGVNALAISIGYYFIIGFYTLMTNKSLLKKLVSIVAMSFMFYFLFRTGTRSAIFGVLAVIILAYPLCYKLSFKRVIIYLFLSGILITGFNYVYEHLGTRLTDRIMSVTTDDFESNVRNRLWQMAYEFSSTNLLGTGSGNEITVYKVTNNEVGEAHNVFFSSLLQLGPLGFLLIFSIMVILLKNILLIKDSNIKFTAVSLFFFFFLQLMKGSFLQTRLFWIPLIFLILAILIDKKNNKQIN